MEGLPCRRRSRVESVLTSVTRSRTGRRSSRRGHPLGPPDVVYVVLDDVGFSAMRCYGGPIATPNIERIADDGVRYDRARKNVDRHPNYILAAFMASGT
jgi:hypothetical protein